MLSVPNLMKDYRRDADAIIHGRFVEPFCMYERCYEVFRVEKES